MDATDQGGQETATHDEFAGISADDISSLLEGTADEIALGVADSEETDERNSASQGNSQLSPEQISDMIKTGVSEAVSSMSHNNGQSQQNTQQQQVNFEAQLETHLSNSLKSKHGLSDEGASFMTSAMMEGLKPIMSMMANGFKALQQKDSAIETQTTLADIDRNLESWLDKKGISDADDRENVITLAKAKAARIPNASMQTLRAEFEKASARFLREAQDAEDRQTNRTQRDRENIPPTPRGNRIGFDDVVKKIAKSQDPQDDIGGGRFVSAVERILANGMSGGGR